MLAKATLSVFTLPLLEASLAGFIQTMAQSMASNTPPEPMPKQPARDVFDIPDETLNNTRPMIEWPSIYDPTPAQVREDDRAIPARQRLDTWNSCGLMVSSSTPKSNFDPEKCGDSPTFELFRATGG